MICTLKTSIKLLLIHKSTPFKIAGLSVVLQPVQKPIDHIAWCLRIASVLVLVLSSHLNLSAQLNLTYDLKKPKSYENRKLKSELTPDKKINPVKRMKENVVAHYNFYFNANNKLQDVIALAKQSHKDSFTNQLAFYNYSLEQTAAQKQELDSVIHKANNGILLHDLRNDWVDDLYLLMGQAYFYQKKFDSAYDVFQYINYTFQPRTKDEQGLEKSIGSNLNTQGNIYTISTKESGISSHPAARNDALVWIVRTLLAQDNNDEAKSLIETLQRDRNFPKRLNDQLAEQKAYLYFKFNQADSSAYYLEKSIDATSSNPEKARRYFLIAQLKTKTGQKESANKFYDKAIALTTDPVMEAFARIYQVALSANEEDFEKRTNEQVELLQRMAKREKYLSYQSIIYNAAAEMEMGRNKSDAAIDLLLKSNAANSNDPEGRSYNNLKIATLAFNDKKYMLAKIYFDSLGLIPQEMEKEVEIKKKVSNELVSLLDIIEKEDSLERIAKMPEKEREAFLKTALKKLKREQGLEEEEEVAVAQNISTGGGRGQRNNLLDETTGNIFSNTEQKGEWYFNNPSLIAQGKTAFKNKWGARPNSDNWRRLTAINGTRIVSQRGTEGARRVTAQQEVKSALSIESLMANLPITKAQQEASLLKKTSTYVQLGMIFQEKLGDWPNAIEWYEKSVNEGVDSSLRPMVYYNLAFCFAQLKNNQQSIYYKNLLAANYPTNELTLKLIDPLAALQQQQAKANEIDKTYNGIYDLFLAGKFETALEAKKQADEKFGANNWSAQLLYIESIYHIKKRNDKEAIATLNKITELYPQTPLAEKAKSIAGVVSRRAEIESELTALQVTRLKEDSLVWIDDRPAPKPQQSLVKKEDTKAVAQQPIVAKSKVDSTQFKAPVTVQQTAARYQFNPSDPYAVMMILKDVDIVYVNEAKRALARYHAERYATNGLNIQNNAIGSTSYILISVFTNAADALSYVEKTAPIGSKEIFPWLQADKYKFIIVSPENLKKMTEDKSTEEYIRFLQQQLPGKF
jgi:tetratricopeptide (TPR) repeat protein